MSTDGACAPAVARSAHQQFYGPLRGRSRWHAVIDFIGVHPWFQFLPYLLPRSARIGVAPVTIACTISGDTALAATWSGSHPNRRINVVFLRWYAPRPPHFPESSRCMGFWRRIFCTCGCWVGRSEAERWSGLDEGTFGIGSLLASRRGSTGNYTHRGEVGQGRSRPAMVGVGRLHDRSQEQELRRQRSGAGSPRAYRRASARYGSLCPVLGAWLATRWSDRAWRRRAG
jgi:hypothetical protein